MIKAGFKVPLTAVIMPVFNRLDLLRSTVDSLRAQTLRESEFILVDDNSDTDTWDFLQELSDKDSRFRIIRKPEGEPRGCQTSRNIGLEACLADYVVFLDSDDLLAPECLEVRYSQIRNCPEVDMLIGRQAIFSNANDGQRWVNIPKPECHDLDRFLDLHEPLDVPWVNGGPMIRRKALVESGIRWSSHYHWDDLVFHFSCLAAGMKVRWMNFNGTGPDCYYRIHGGEHYGNTLHSWDGIRNSAQMMVWMMKQLQKHGQWNESRRLQLTRSFFHICILKPAACQQYGEALELLKVCKEFSLLTQHEMRMIGLYLRGRQAFVISKRLTYRWNRVARYSYLKKYFNNAAWTYATISPDRPTRPPI